MGRKISTQSDMHPYMKVGFYNDPANFFWNSPGQMISDPKTGAVDQVMEWSPKAKDYFERSKDEIMKRARYKLHSL